MSARDGGYSRFAEDPNLIEDWNVKSYLCHEIIIEVCLQHGLRCKIITPDSLDYLVVQITCTKNQYKVAQQEWCRRMAVSGAKPATKGGEPW